jgi:hypothetical protein
LREARKKLENERQYNDILVDCIEENGIEVPDRPPS